MKEISETKKNEYCNGAIKLKIDIERDFIVLGEMLYRIKKEQMFEAGWSSWEEFEMELKLSSATISKIIRIYEIFCLRYSFTAKVLAEAGGWSSIAEVLPVINEDTTRKRAEELLDICTTQSRTDVRRTIQEAKTGVDMTKCKHLDTYTLQICRDCGERIRLEEK